MKHQDIMRAHRKLKKILTWYCSGSAPHGALYAIVCQYNSEVALEGQGNGFWYFLGPAPVWRQSLRITAIVSNIDATQTPLLQVTTSPILVERTWVCQTLVLTFFSLMEGRFIHFFHLIMSSEGFDRKNFHWFLFPWEAIIVIREIFQAPGALWHLLLISGGKLLETTKR